MPKSPCSALASSCTIGVREKFLTDNRPPNIATIRPIPASSILYLRMHNKQCEFICMTGHCAILTGNNRLFSPNCKACGLPYSTASSACTVSHSQHPDNYDCVTARPSTPLAVALSKSLRELDLTARTGFKLQSLDVEFRRR